MTVRQSRYLPHRSAANVSRALTHASTIGRPLNLWVTINYGLTGCNEEDMSAAFRRLLKSFFGKWHARHRALIAAGTPSPAYAWVAEGRPGHHGVHWLLNLPQRQHPEFRRELTRWLEKTAGPILDDKAIDIRIPWSAGGAMGYMMKGLKPAHAKRFRVDHVFQGVVFAKRCGFSETLGPAAIKRYREAQEAAQASA